MRSLRAKLLIYILGLFLAGTSVLALVNYNSSQHLLTENIYDLTEELAGNLANTMEDRLSGYQELLAAWANLPEVKEMNWDVMGPYFQEEAKQIQGLELFFMADGLGNAVDSSGGELYIGDRDYFPPALGGRAVISQPLINRNTGEPAIVIANPIEDQGGEIVGILGMTVTLEEITKFIAETQLGINGYAFALANDGTVVAHRNTDLLLVHNYLTDTGKTDVVSVATAGEDAVTEATETADVVTGATEATSSATQIIGTEIVSGKRGHIEYTRDATDYLVAYAPVPLSDWGVAVVLPQEEILAPLHNLTKTSLFYVSVILLAGIVAGLFLAASVVKPIEVLTKAAQGLARGDLTQQVKIKSRDEIGSLATAFNSMGQELKRLIGSISGGAELLNQSAREISVASEETAKAAEDVAAAINQLALGATDQAEKAQDSTEKLTEMLTELEGVAQRSREATSGVNRTMQVVEQGVIVVRNQNEAMEANEAAVRKVSGTVENLAQQAGEIGTIIEVISAISEQTNLLALNAAIEAARAGEQGRGFAVVAEEVRKLAEQSGQATGRISRIIEDIGSGVKEAHAQMLVALDSVLKQKEATGETEESFREIQETILLFNDLVKGIATAAQQLNTVADSVAGGVTEIAVIAQEGAASTEEIAAATQEQAAAAQELTAGSQNLSNLAAQLEEEVAGFKL